MLAIVLTTYNRLEYAQATLRSTLDNLVTREPIWLHIADDGSPFGYVDELLALARGYRLAGVSTSNSQRKGYGANYNAAYRNITQLVDVSHVLILEDDWRLERALDMDRFCRAFGDPRIDVIRLGYIGYTDRLTCDWVWIEPDHYLLFDPNCPEPHVFAGHPRIERFEHYSRVGEWPEGVEAGMTEFSVAHYPPAREGIAWPVSLVHPDGNMYVHIGEAPCIEPDVLIPNATAIPV